MDPFDKLAEELDVGPVTKPAHPSRPQRMNANSFCVGNKVFAMRVGNYLALKLAPERVADLIKARTAEPHLVGRHAMKEWVNISRKTQGQWLALARESLGYVRDKR